MTDDRCTNCGTTADGTYELLIRSRSHDEVPLCDACHEAIEDELTA